MASGSEIEEISMDDLERQANPPSRALSWKSIRVPTIVSIKSTIGSTSTSFLSNVSNIRDSVLSLRRMGTNSTNTTLAHSNKSIKLGLLSDSDTCKAFDEPLAETDRNDIDKVSKALVHAISGGVTNSNIVNSAANWYIDLLKRQCKVAWINIIGPVIEPGDPLPTGATEMNLCKVFRILRTVVLTIRKEEDVALSDLVDALYNEEKWRIVDDDRCLVELLAFTAFGWLTMLYTPTSYADRKSLQILGPENLAPPKSKLFGLSGRHRLESSTFFCLEQDLQYVDRSLTALLANFGKILPEVQQNSMGGNLRSAGHQKSLEEFIEVPQICFYTLHHFAKIKIQWVDCLSLHLEYDSHRKILRLFRFPSLCLLMCYSHNNYLNRFFRDLDTAQDDTDGEKNYAHDYYKEVLLSYRLIFAESRCSHAIYNTLKADWPQLSDDTHDPLLDIVCGQSWKDEESKEIWDDIHARYPVHRYYTSETFRFLGPRLTLLQDAAGGLEPDGIWPLWYDKRDTLRWWTFWAVLIMGAAAIFLGFLQVILQILQLYYTIRPAN